MLSLLLLLSIACVAIGQQPDLPPPPPPPQQSAVQIVNPPAALFQARATSADQLDPCQYMLQNLTSIETLQAHEVATLEQCLYYYLAGETAKRMRRFGIPHPIASVPPNYESKQPVSIKFNQLTLQHFELNEFMKDIAIHGYLEMNWIDDRLVWSDETWKTKKLQVQSLNHIWFPLFIAQSFDTHLKNGDAFEMRKVETSNEGNVSAILAFSLRTFCDDGDFVNFPDDIYKCCFSLEPQANQEIIQFQTSGLPIFTDPKYFRDYGWKVSGTVPQTVNDPAQVAQLGFCLNLQRASSAVRIEMTVPLLIVSLLFLLSSFLGQIKLQIFVKLVLLALQFVTLLLYSNRIAQFLGGASSTPRLLRFLEFSIMINGVSISISILIFALARIRRELPPWGRLTTLTNLVNKALCLLQTPEPDETISMDKVETGGRSYQQDWNAAFSALHAVLMAGISLIFIFGYLILL